MPETGLTQLVWFIGAAGFILSLMCMVDFVVENLWWSARPVDTDVSEDARWEGWKR